jgi:hypothetical protein
MLRATLNSALSRKRLNAQAALRPEHLNFAKSTLFIAKHITKISHSFTTHKTKTTSASHQNYST